MKKHFLSLTMALMLAFVGVAQAQNTMPESCNAPENLKVFQGVHSARVTWTGASNTAYKVSLGDQTITVNANEPTGVTFENLDAATAYSVIVETLCEEHPMATKDFTTGRYWDDAAAWAGGQIPATNGVANIPENTTVVIRSTDNITVSEVIMGTNSNLVIEDGGLLKYSNQERINVTMTLGNSLNNTKGSNNAGYILLAPPTYRSGAETFITVEESQLMLDYENSDLYSFDQSSYEAWRNYKAGAFTNLELGKGYLYYASPMFGIFTGMSLPSSIPYEVNLNYTSSAEFAGWNLIGNPYTTKAYPNMPFYVLNSTGDEIVPSNDNFVLPARGFFVIADGANQTCTMTTTQPATSSLGITVNQEQNMMDAAVVSFDNRGNLDKVQLNQNHTKIYMPLNGKDYAVLQAENSGEMPINFKAETDGTYTLNFSNCNVEFSQLRLIDNITGVETNLLQTPTYTFSAKTTDFASRFRLVFNANTTNEEVCESSFAFVNTNGDLIVEGIEGMATLQVIDITGRMISNEQFNGSYSKHFDMVPGVYMIRLVQNNDVKVQKVIVK